MGCLVQYSIMDRYLMTDYETAKKDYADPEGFLLSAEGPWGEERRCATWLVDTKKMIIVFVDDGEPEDQTLGRNYSRLVDLLNNPD